MNDYVTASCPHCGTENTAPMFEVFRCKSCGEWLRATHECSEEDCYEYLEEMKRS